MEQQGRVFSGTKDGAASKLTYILLEGAAESAPGREGEAHYGQGPNVARPLTRWRRLSDAFFSATRCFADRTALQIGQRSYGYAELRRQALCVSTFLLREVRLQTGDRVALMLDNGPEFIAAYFGVLAAGGVVVPLPANIESGRLDRIVSLCSIQTILSSRRLLRRRPDVALSECHSVNVTRDKVAAIPEAESLQVDGQSLAMIMFTSGSSGDPKGVMLSDRNLLANTESIVGYLPITHEDRALALLPFYHAFGHSILQTHLLSGATLIVDGNMAFPGTVVDALEHHRATSFSAVPEGYYSLLSLSDLAKRPLPHLRYMSVAGGALKPSSVVEMARSIAPADFFVMYGQTEASARLAYLPADSAQSLPDSIGIPIPGVELRVLNEQGCEAAPDETGELCARGPNVMLGYWNDTAGTSKVLQNGWLRTGDLARRDERGYFHVEARKNDLVKVQGFRIHPREVEDAIAEHFPGVRIVVVPYQQDATTRLALFGITRKVEPGLALELQRICLRELPRHKVPTYLEVLTQAPLNASMKLDRTALGRRAELGLGPAPQGELDGPRSGRLSA